MARTISITAQHGLGVEGVKARISERFAKLKADHTAFIGDAGLRWDGDVAHAYATALGAKATARLTAGHRELRIEIVLPLLLAPFGGLVDGLIRSNADALEPAA